jgi:methyl-accepting chemotaxis protein
MSNWIRNLGLKRKFAILALLSLVQIGVLLWFGLSGSEDNIQVARTERAGVAPLGQLVKLVQFTQQHRGLSANVLGGNTALESNRSAKQGEIEQVVQGLSASTAQNMKGAALINAWSKATTEWKSLSAAVASRAIPGQESNARHAALIANYLELIEAFADEFGITLDPEAATYHLQNAALVHLANLTEALGQTRARGALMLAQGTATEEDRHALAAVASLAADRQKSVSRALAKVFESSKQSKSALESDAREAASQVDGIVRLVRGQVLGKERLDYSATDYTAATTRAIDAQFKLIVIAMQQFDGLLEARVREFRQKELLILAVLIGFVLAAGWLAYAVMQSILVPLQHAVRVSEAIATGDLSQNIEVRSKDELGQLMVAMKRTVGQLNVIVRNIKASSDTVGTAAQEIAQGHADLSSRTEEQASSLEETAASMEEMTSTVQQNAENAKKASTLAAGATETAQAGGEAVRRVVHTMTGISDSSKKIADITSVIDGIAFQTNILALNAAVEAARAGEQGRGFAVVASEVRSLAQRSAAAAKEIKGLITDSVSKVDSGSREVAEAGKTMEKIVESVNRVSSLIAEISAASQEQSQSISQVSDTVQQLEKVTQQNAAMVEQATAASASLEEQSGSLIQAVDSFKLADTTSRVAPPVASAPAAAVPASRAAPVALPRPAKAAPKKQLDVPKKRAVAAGAAQQGWEEF